MAAPSEQSPATASKQPSSIAISERGRRRLASLKPYDSVSYEELLMEMADIYEAQNS